MTAILDAVDQGKGQCVEEEKEDLAVDCIADYPSATAPLIVAAEEDLKEEKSLTDNTR